MPKTLVLFYSRTGTIARLAEAVAEGVREVRFAEVDVRRLDDVGPAHVVEADAEWSAARERLAATYRTLESVERLAEYDAVILGAPGRYGVMAAELKLVLDQAAPLRERGALTDRVGSAFTSAHLQGGHHPTLWSMLTGLASLGMILVPPGAGAPVPFDGGSNPYDAAGGGRALTDADLAAARQLGKRVATVAGWIRHARSHHH